MKKHLISPELRRLRKVRELFHGRSFLLYHDQRGRPSSYPGSSSRFGFQFGLKDADALDSGIESAVNYAYDGDLGFLTACPTNLGTGMRASVMMHLPGLVMSKNMEKVINAVNHLGIAVRGLFGEGSDANGSIFQISNQQTLGESESAIIERLNQLSRVLLNKRIMLERNFCKMTGIGLLIK